MTDEETFEAGNGGESVKSDCLVTYRPDGETLSIEVSGEPADGSDPEREIRAAASWLGVETGSFSIEDSASAPFVVRARALAALLMAFPGRLRLPGRNGSTKGSPAQRPRRSRLYVPGNNPRFLARAGASGADGIILDLEDSVAPDRKMEARVLVAHALDAIDFGDSEVMVRINQGEEGLTDLEWVVPGPVQLILVPKVEHAAQVESVSSRIEEIASRCGREEPVWLMPIIESPLGILQALEIARAAESSVALTLGLQDLSAEMGTTPTEHGTESLVARSLVVLAARAAGLQPIDTVYTDVKNEEGLRESIRRARELGFVGKGCIHPAQVGIVNDSFLPTAKELEKARNIVLAMEEAERRGLGAIALGSKMIDPPVAAQARNLIDNAIRLGQLGEDWRDRG